jgi:hypothetical protein
LSSGFCGRDGLRRVAKNGGVGGPTSAVRIFVFLMGTIHFLLRIRHA